MSYTNKTTNYELPQWLGTDKPTFLGDLNGAFLAIDTAMKDNATAASGANTLAGTADGKADANALAIQGLDTQINTPGTGLAADVAANALAIQGVADKVGTGTLDTTAQNCVDAINELNAEVNPGSVSVTSDGVKTYGQIMADLFGLLDLNKVTGKSYFTTGLFYGHPIRQSATSLMFEFTHLTPTGVDISKYNLSSTGEYHTWSIADDGTITRADNSALVPNADAVYTVVY